MLPNTFGGLAVNFGLNFPATVLLESSLSFLGLGVQPPGASLGTLLSEGRDYFLQAPWIALSAGGIISLTTLSICIITDDYQRRSM